MRGIIMFYKIREIKFRVSQKFYEKINDFCKENGFKTKSRFIRYSIKEQLNPYNEINLSVKDLPEIEKLTLETIQVNLKLNQIKVIVELHSRGYQIMSENDIETLSSSINQANDNILKLTKLIRGLKDE